MAHSQVRAFRQPLEVYCRPVPSETQREGVVGDEAEKEKA